MVASKVTITAVVLIMALCWFSISDLGIGFS